MKYFLQKLTALTVLIMLSCNAQAQLSPIFTIDKSESNKETQNLYDEIKRLKQENDSLSSKLYNNSTKAPVINKSPANIVAKLEARIDQLQQEIRTLNGKVEEANYKSAKVSSKLDSVMSDMEFRFGQYDEKLDSKYYNLTNIPTNVNEQLTTSLNDNVKAVESDINSGISSVSDDIDNKVNGVSASAFELKEESRRALNYPVKTVIDQAVVEAANASAAAAESSTSSAVAAAAEEGRITLQDLESPVVKKAEELTKKIDYIQQYKSSVESIKKGEYDKAESSLTEFISNNEDSELIGNAYYWLGETYYVENDYNNSAVNFLMGYQKDPKGIKAPDNLLKLGMSLESLKKKDEACTTYSKMILEYPKISKELKKKVYMRRDNLSCQ